MKITSESNIGERRSWGGKPVTARNSVNAEMSPPQDGFLFPNTVGLIHTTGTSAHVLLWRHDRLKQCGQEGEC